MKNVLGIILSLVMIILFISQLRFAIKSFLNENHKKMCMHILGCISSLLVLILTILVILGTEITSSALIITTFVIVTIFFIVYSISTMFVSK